VSAANPTFSVVMPLHDKAASVGEAVASVLGQTEPDLELIVVDDGSTDGGAEIALASEDPRVLLLSQANAGAAAARNRGVAAATAPLVAFLDADDRWDPGFLATVRRLAEAHPECGVFATGYRIARPGAAERPAVVRGLPPPPWEGELEDYFAVAAVSDPPVFSSAVAVRREAVVAVGGFPVGVAAGEDLLTWARLAARFPVAYSTGACAVHRRPAGYRPSRRPAPHGEDHVGAGLRALLAARPTPGLRSYLAHWHTMRASIWLRLGEGAEARRDVLAAVGLVGWSAKLAAFAALAALPGPAARAAALAAAAVRGGAGARA